MRPLLMMSSIAMGGAERIMVAKLPYLLDLGLDAKVCTLNTRRDSPLTEKLVQTGVQRYDLSAKRMLDYAAWRRFVQVLRDEQIDIIHAQDQDTIVYGALAHRLLGIPTVMTRHVLVEPAPDIKKFLRAQLVLKSSRFGYNRVVTVSDAVRQDFSKRAHIPLNRIQTIYNGIDLDKFDTREGRAAKRAELGWAAEDKIVVMVAVLRAGKGHEVLFKAIPQIKAALPDAKIKLVGGGELEESLKKQAAPHADVVEFMGERMDVPEILGASDLLVLPSWSEALPTVLLEAGAACLPVVATDVGGTKEIVNEGETGYVVPAGDAQQFAARIITVLQDLDHAHQMGERARQWVTDHFSFEKQASELKALYDTVINESQAKKR